MLRITGGAWRGRTLHPPAMAGLRPTPARVREALFQVWQGAELLDRPLLDLFAGSGALAIEALSRGVPRVISIERDRRAVRAMQRARAAFGLVGEQWRIVQADVRTGLRRVGEEGFGVVFADPPYAFSTPERVPHWLDAAGIECVELAIERRYGEAPAWPAGWRLIETRRYGDSAVHRLRRR